MIVITGREFENLFFGRKLERGGEEQRPRFCTVPTAIAEAKKIQRSWFEWNPAVPRTRMAMSFFNAVRQALPSSARKWLLLYCAVDTALDWHHDTDMFFTLHLPRRAGEGVVLVDLTLQSEKTLVSVDVYLSREHLESPQKLKTVGEYIADLLMERAQRRKKL